MSRSGRAALAFAGVGLLCFLGGLGVAVSLKDNNTASNFLYLGSAGASLVFGLIGLVVGARAQPKTPAANWAVVLGVIDVTAFFWGEIAIVLMSCATGGVACS